MHKEAIISDVKRQNRQRIAKYILEKKQTSRQELAKALGYSMPTVFANVNELIEQGFVCEAGEYGSTGGRKAKVLTINRNHRSVMGLDITKRHIRMLLLDITGEILKEDGEMYGDLDGEVIFSYENEQGEITEQRQKFSTVIKKPQVVELKVEKQKQETNQWWITIIILVIR